MKVGGWELRGVHEESLDLTVPLEGSKHGHSSYLIFRHLHIHPLLMSEECIHKTCRNLAQVSLSKEATHRASAAALIAAVIRAKLMADEEEIEMREQVW
eukprot:1162080-Pelagomonas_calceolata.AAC.3